MSHTQYNKLHRRNSIAQENPLPRPAPTVMCFPSPEIPNLPSDWWHDDSRIRIINGTGDLWSGDSILFFPDHGRRVQGISMKQARLGIGMLHGQTPLRKWVHPSIFNDTHPMLSIQWPGYHFLDESFHERDGFLPLNIKRPLHLDGSVTLAEVARQVAEYFFGVSELYSEHCNLHDPKALLLGPGGITFDRLRLVKLWTSNRGGFWNAEIAVVDDYIR
ncbi:hypothetical protein K438DRAFT_1978472 [Mycena galopus ATCC 62051]|nr:hypothetical protein K438DRAFT_1978472 [Mycena galopus ATCC 62051]